MPRTSATSRGTVRRDFAARRATMPGPATPLGTVRASRRPADSPCARAAVRHARRDRCATIEVRSHRRRRDRSADAGAAPASAPVAAPGAGQGRGSASRAVGSMRGWKRRAIHGRDVRAVGRPNRSCDPDSRLIELAIEAALEVSATTGRSASSHLFRKTAGRPDRHRRRSVRFSAQVITVRGDIRSTGRRREARAGQVSHRDHRRESRGHRRPGRAPAPATMAISSAAEGRRAWRRCSSGRSGRG